MKKILSILALSLCMVSCVDTVILPDDKVVDENMWKTKADVAGIVSCAYAQLRDESLQRNLIVWGDFRSDELVLSPSLDNSAAYKTDLSQIYSLNILPANSFTNWNALYTAINYCNIVLERAGEVISIDPNYTQGDYEVDCSKVKALRALCYFYLVRVFRDVPMSLSAYMTSNQDAMLAQQAPSVVLDQCIKDLQEAEVDAISSDAYHDWRDKGYMTRDAICALLADIYLWRASVYHSESDYNACVTYCDKVIASKKNAHQSSDEEAQNYYLSKRDYYYEEVFSEDKVEAWPGRKIYNTQGVSGMNSEESIFEIQYISALASDNTPTKVQNNGMYQMYQRYKDNASALPAYFMATEYYGKTPTGTYGSSLFLNSEDIRRADFMYLSDDASSYRVRKYVASTGSASSVGTQSSRRLADFHQNWIVYRLSDVMLMKAEALVQLYELSAKTDEDNHYISDAFALVDAVNRRSLLEDTQNGLSFSFYKDKMEDLVLQERARELCFEGKRWFDLMRYNYRHVDGVQYDKTFAQQEGEYIENNPEFLSMVIKGKYDSEAVKAKMPTEPYLYWPINTAQIDYNTNLVQNPVWRASSSTARQ